MKNFIKIFFLKVLLFFILKTCKWKTNNLKALNREISLNRSIMLSCWHENLVFFACFFKSWSKKNFWVISSTHRDSEVLASVLKSWEYRLIKGSSPRGWMPVLKKLLEIFSMPNNIVAITNDGPRGPAKQTKPGAFRAALRKNITIIGMTGKASSFWTLNTWDQLKIPKPFSTITLSFGNKYAGDDRLKSFNNYLNKI